MKDLAAVLTPLRLCHRDQSGRYRTNLVQGQGVALDRDRVVLLEGDVDDCGLPLWAGAP